MKPKALYFCHITTSFTKIDTQILAKEYDVVPFEFHITSAYKIPFLWIKQKLFILKHFAKTELIFCMFAGYHSILPALFAKLFNKPCIIVAGGIDSVSFPSVGYGNFNKKVLGKLTAWSYRLCSAIAPISDYLVVSEYTYQDDDFRRQGFLYHVKNLKTPYQVIYNGFETDKWFYNNEVRKPNSFLSIAANLDSESRRKIKGIDMVIEAAKLFPNYSFTIIGSNAENASFTVPTNVTVIPFVPHHQLRMLYCQHEYYFQLSMSEGFGNTLAEAMLCECIIIGSNAGAIPFIVNQNGFILKRKDASELKQIIEQAVAYPNKITMKQKARERIIANFSIEQRSKKIYQLIHQING